MHKYQRGGTLLGIIIGLVIGLGIALGVAVTINKTPLPFMDKSGRQGKVEPPSQITDPNKPLYGNKSAAKEAAKEFVKESEPPVNTAAQQPENKTPAADAIGDKIAEKLKKPEKAEKPEPKAAEVKIGEAPKDAAAKADEDKFNYYLQAGAFREQADAEALRAKLALIGVEAKISERQSENGMLYRVRVGPFGQLDAMNKVRSKLSENSVDAAVLRVAK
jgi:cell division protein FtsN